MDKFSRNDEFQRHKHAGRMASESTSINSPSTTQRRFSCKQNNSSKCPNAAVEYNMSVYWIFVSTDDKVSSLSLSRKLDLYRQCDLIFAHTSEIAMSAVTGLTFILATVGLSHTDFTAFCLTFVCSNRNKS